MKLQIYQADAFTDQLFGGNPAAIVPLKEWLSAPLMQKIAAENNLAETAFFVPQGENFELRWFTPEVEIDLCGHATLATAHILFTELGYTKDIIHFHTLKAGTLAVSKTDDVYTLDFPSRPLETCDAPNGLLEALGNTNAVEVLKLRDYVVVYKTEAEIANLKPDFNALLKVDAFAITVTSKGDNSDFVSRFFAPAAGINEDPVTGSAHCNLIPYWSEKLGKTKLHAFQISERRGELWCELKADRVLMAGNAVTYLRGEIYI
ncbi:PhzF family phenazine biosynthesis protein [Pedobacter boryungensis]|uniref:PhzF family phenazine biosynthesis protein n=1 Tax=Pedobacter boryungensis TaxID=869962 RepID=A0ABX2D8T8_9SPHI|nr:PhzF family phenazine biosynthesis protein [Pedobacter boryungensis]NQX30470.1 PhzF family phenazine biosynthesis protein [Pedobacter boryungensis]